MQTLDILNYVRIKTVIKACSLSVLGQQVVRIVHTCQSWATTEFQVFFKYKIVCPANYEPMVGPRVLQLL